MSRSPKARALFRNCSPLATNQSRSNSFSNMICLLSNTAHTYTIHAIPTPTGSASMARDGHRVHDALPVLRRALRGKIMRLRYIVGGKSVFTNKARAIRSVSLIPRNARCRKCIYRYIMNNIPTTCKSITRSVYYEKSNL